MEKLSAVHHKTLSRLEHIMLDYDFEIKYLKGAVIPADYLSRNVLETIDIFSTDLPGLQNQDEFCASIRKFLQDGSVPTNGSKANYIKQIGPQCFLENDILWRRMRRIGMPVRTVLVVPRSICMELVKEAHGSLFVGHNAVEKCRERLLQSYFWPNMDKDVRTHLDSCSKCQARKKTGSSYNYLQPMPQCTAPNQRVHIDLFGPLKTTNGKKYILTATDAFTKYCDAWPIDNKQADTVAKVLFEKYFLRFGCCQTLYSDNGLEFCNKTCDELCKLMQIQHNTTTAWRPESNSQAEVFNKTIAKYLSSFVDEKTTNWIDYINPMLFAYNTSYHSTTKCTPFFLTYGYEARYPSNNSPDLQYHYGSSLPSKWFAQLQEARLMAEHHSIQASETSRDYFDSHTFPHKFVLGQLVWLNEVNFAGRNRKLSPNWTGPYPIVKIVDSVVELKLPRRSVRVNVNRVKPYIAPVQIEKRLTDVPHVQIYLANQRQENVPNFLQQQNADNQNLAVRNNAQDMAVENDAAVLPNLTEQQQLAQQRIWNAMRQQQQNAQMQRQVPTAISKNKNNDVSFRNIPFANTNTPPPPPEPVLFPANDVPFRHRSNLQRAPPPSHPFVEVQDEFVTDKLFSQAAKPAVTQRTSLPRTCKTAHIKPVLEKLIFPRYSRPLQVRKSSALSLAKQRAALSLKVQAQNVYDANCTVHFLMALQQKKGSPPPAYRLEKETLLGPVYTRDKYGLPVGKPNTAEPDWIIKRRNFLSKLSVQDRNLLLTGDPYFQFDPIVYNYCFFSRAVDVPQILQQNFPYLLPDQVDIAVQADFTDSDTSDSDTPDPDNASDPDSDPAPVSDHNPDTTADYETADSDTPVNSDSPDSSLNNTEVPCSPTPAIPGDPNSPSMTRSGRHYSGPSPSSASQAPSNFGLPGLFSRLGRAAGNLLDSHPLSSQQPKAAARRKKKEDQ